MVVLAKIDLVNWVECMKLQQFQTSKKLIESEYRHSEAVEELIQKQLTVERENKMLDEYNEMLFNENIRIRNEYLLLPPKWNRKKFIDLVLSIRSAVK